MPKNAVSLPLLLVALLSLTIAHTSLGQQSSAPVLPYSPSLDLSSMDKSNLCRVW